MRPIFLFVLLLALSVANAQHTGVSVRWDEVRGDANITNRSVFNVLDFGAKGNGTTDDTLAISNANFQAQRANVGQSPIRPALTNTTVYFPAGIYKTTAKIVINTSSIKWRGEAAIGQCVITNSTTMVLEITNAANDVTIEGIAFRSNNARTNEAIVVHTDLDAHDRIILRNCSAYGFSYGTLWSNVSNSSIEDCDFSNDEFGLRAAGTYCNGNYVRMIATQCKSAAYSLDSGAGWNIDMQDTGGTDSSIGIPFTTNIIQITGSPAATFNGGNSEDWGGNVGINHASVKCTGAGGYRLLFNNFNVSDFSTNANLGWSVDLADSHASTSWVHFNNCSLGVNSNVNAIAAFPAVKITSPAQRVTAVGQKIVAAYYVSGVFYTNCALFPEPTTAEDNFGPFASPAYYGYVQWALTNGSPRKIINTPVGFRYIDGSDAAKLSAVNTFTTTNQFNGTTELGSLTPQTRPVEINGGANSGFSFVEVPIRVYSGSQEGGRTEAAYDDGVGGYAGVYVLSANGSVADRTPQRNLWLWSDGSVRVKNTGIFTNSVFIVGTTNQVKFGATNTAPAQAVTVNSWISVQVNGDTAVYRLPLYK